MKKIFLVLLLAGALTNDVTAQNREMAIGCWSMPSYHPEEHLFLGRDGQFNFTDWNKRKQSLDELSGQWSYEGGKVVLYYDDRTKQAFAFRKNSRGKLYLSKAGGFVLNKTDPSTCNGR